LTCLGKEFAPDLELACHLAPFLHDDTQGVKDGSN